MFDLTERDYIKAVIDSREEDKYVIPLYVKIYNNTYSLLELDKIEEYDERSFKVGFGSSTKLLMKNSFLDRYRYELEFIDKFEHYDYEENKGVSYIIFESGGVDYYTSNMHKQINSYIDALNERIKSICEKNHKPISLDEYFLDIDYSD